ncbi:MAG: zinc ribbon-containing protein [Verrucomicrobiota bacterium]
MAAHTGEQAREGGDFRCQKCHHQVRVNKGEKIPKCPNCGNTVFDTRLHETSGAGKEHGR